jgi:hypothetical protein
VFDFRKKHVKLKKKLDRAGLENIMPSWPEWVSRSLLPVSSLLQTLGFIVQNDRLSRARYIFIDDHK